MRITILFFLLVILNSSCSKKARESMDPPAKKITKQEAINAVKANNYHFDWLVSKGKMNMNSPSEKFSGKFYFRMKRDSIIWMVIKKFSAEAVRTLITEDSIYVLDRINTQYSIDPYDQMEKITNRPLIFEELQDYLFGNIEINISEVKSVEIVDNRHKIMVNKSGYDFDIFLYPQSLRISEIYYRHAEGLSIRISLDQYDEVETGTWLSFLREIEIDDPKNGLSKAKLEFSQIELDKPRLTKFTIPKHYDRIYN